MKVLVLPAKKEPYLKDVENDLDKLRELIDCEMIETVTMPDKTVMLMDEEGKLKNLPKNRHIKFGDLRGNVVICGRTSEDFGGLSKDTAKHLLRIFRNGEDSCYFCRYNITGKCNCLTSSHCFEFIYCYNKCKKFKWVWIR